jgi:hypothetical protein
MGGLDRRSDVLTGPWAARGDAVGGGAAEDDPLVGELVDDLSALPALGRPVSARFLPAPWQAEANESCSLEGLPLALRRPA